MDSPFVCMEMITLRNRKAGSRVQNVTPKPETIGGEPNPGHSPGRPTQEASSTPPAS